MDFAHAHQWVGMGIFQPMQPNLWRRKLDAKKALAVSENLDKMGLALSNLHLLFARRFSAETASAREDLEGQSS